MADPTARLTAQVSAAATRLHRQTERPAIILVLNQTEAGTALAFGIEDANLGEVEFAAFMLLRWIENELLPGSAEGCAGCQAAHARVAQAVAVLEPAMRPDADLKGRC